MNQQGESSAVSEELVPGSKKMYIFFGGIAGAIGMAPFEFYKASRILDCNRLFIRDLSQSWYQRGLPGIGADPLAVGEYLRSRIEESGATEVRFVGNSMGGFGALFFCAMLQRGQVIAFAPQTFVSPSARLRSGDQRWSPQVKAMHASNQGSDIYELSPWIQAKFPDMQAHICVSSSDELDVAHANELAGFPGIAVQSFQGGGHSLVAMLRNNGTLARILAM